MNRYEDFRVGILEQARSAAQANHYITKNTWGLASEYGIPESHVREELLRLAELGLIELSAWDGERERQHNEWADADSLFSNTTGYVHIRLLSAGGELLSKTPKSPIGFTASGGIL